MGLQVGLLRRIDAYLDAAPDGSAEAVDVGPLRAFVSHAPWPFYVRPRPDLDLGSTGAVSADDVRRAAAVLTDAGQAVSFEWVEQLVPSLHRALVESGLRVTSHPLLALDLDAGRTPGAGRVRPGTRILDAASPDVTAALAVSDVGFAAAGTAAGPEGLADRDAVTVEDALVDHVRVRIRAGRSVVAVLEEPGHGVIATGWHQPIGDTTEVVGVATLPAFRRHGAAVDVVARLLDDARGRGITLALLSASDDDVARVYERVGFTRVGSCGAADART